MALTRRRTEAFQVLDSPGPHPFRSIHEIHVFDAGLLESFRDRLLDLLPILLEELSLLVRQVFALEGKVKMVSVRPSGFGLLILKPLNDLRLPYVACFS